MASLKITLLCCVIMLAIFVQEGESWGRFRFRTPRIRLPRIRLPRIRLPRIRLPRIRLPRISLPRLSSILPRIRLPCFVRLSFSSGVPLLRSMQPGLHSFDVSEIEALFILLPHIPVYKTRF
ncbi:hypothetical protein LSH36_872g01022 [Paralvinella palmiformis]|uniref:Uncharacterized protein n=1 Tax=Paralvinella palmiformis TaxID=53620 RepID=A0AAD9IZG3_9ANNE|nr:hypothetical protein LSH36_872g01022 [Paralvinella palmiformis]